MRGLLSYKRQDGDKYNPSAQYFQEESIKRLDGKKLCLVDFINFGLDGKLYHMMCFTLGDRISRKVYLQTCKAGPILVQIAACSDDERIVEKLIKEEDYLLDLTKRYFNLLEKLEKSEENEAIQHYTWDRNVVYVSEGKHVFTFLQDDLGSTIRLVDLQKNQQVIIYCR